MATSRAGYTCIHLIEVIAMSKESDESLDWRSTPLSVTLSHPIHPLLFRVYNTKLRNDFFT